MASYSSTAQGSHNRRLRVPNDPGLGRLVPRACRMISTALGRSLQRGQMGVDDRDLCLFLSANVRLTASPPR
jgi:hypothetical protein